MVSTNFEFDSDNKLISDTVLFLGKAVLAALLIIRLVQFIADQEV
jgi:hypothetical protein